MIRHRSGSADERLLRHTALRIGLQTGAAMAAVVLALATVAVLVVLRGQHAADDDLMNIAIAKADDVTDPPSGTWLVIQDGGTRQTSPGLPAGFPDIGQLDATAADGVSRAAEAVIGGREYRVETRRHSASRTIQAVLDLSANHEQRMRLLLALLTCGAVGLLLSAGLGVWLARRAAAPMAHALAMQRRFVADAGHELRTPLTLLSTRAQLINRNLDDGTSGATVRSDVDGLVRDARQLTAVLDDLLLAADPRSLTPVGPVELTGLVCAVVNAGRPAAEESGVSITLSTVDDPVTVTGSEAGLRRALTALLDNAVRHARTEVRVLVATYASAAIIDVVDDGPGVDPNVLPRIFERFAASTVDRQEHDRHAHRRYGLGLALVSEIAARHGGSVVAGTADTGGTRFRLKLPVTRRSRRQEFSQKRPAG